MSTKITTPEEEFGFSPGTENTLIGWKAQVAYYKKLAEQSDRMIIDEMATTPDGNPFLSLIISSPDNLKNLDRYMEISLKLAQYRKYNAEETEALAKEGKAILVASMSIHSHEIGGGQTSPVLVHHLLSDNSEKTLSILENVIFILQPNANPDGLDLEEEWYGKYKDTYYADLRHCCVLYHKYAGHSNNRDFIIENLIESRCIDDYLFRKCHANINLDFHQVPYDFHRMILSAPGADPVREELSPLLMRELGACGMGICCALEEEDIPDIAYGWPEFSYDIYFSLSTTPRFHNIISILSESAFLRRGLRGEYLRGKRCGSKDGIPSVNNPHPWEGGMWTPADVVREIFVAAIGGLEFAARNKDSLLRNAALMAVRQTERGAKSEEQGYLIPLAQHDRSALHRLIQVLDAHRIEYCCTTEDVITDFGVECPAGSIYVPLAQPDYAFVSILLRQRKEPDNKYTKEADGTYTKKDGASSNIAEWMGVEVYPCGKELTCKTVPYVEKYEGETALPAPVSSNDSYKLVNRLLREGKRVWVKDGSFTDTPSELEIKQKRIGLLFIPRDLGLDDPPFANLFLTMFDFDYRLIDGYAIRDGALDEIDVLIVPGFRPGHLEDEDYDLKLESPELKIAIGHVGEELIKKFVKRGGRLVAWTHSCDYLIDHLNLPVKNVTAGVEKRRYQAGGSTLRAHCHPDDLTLGMPEDPMLFCLTPPCFVSENDYRCKGIVSFAKQNILSSGFLVGEELIAGKYAGVKVRYGEGEVILYGFSPVYQMQADGQYKFLLNALYDMEK